MRARPAVATALTLLATWATAIACTSGTRDLPSDDGALAGSTIEVVAPWGPTAQDSFSAAVDTFEQRTGARVHVTAVGTDVQRALSQRILRGNPPDVAVLPDRRVLLSLARRDALRAVGRQVERAVDRGYAPVWKQLGSADGTLYGVWFGASTSSTFWYRTSVLAQAGVSDPETWDDLLSVTATLRRGGVTPLSLAGADDRSMAAWFANAYLSVAGPQAYDQLVRRDIPWTDATVTRTLTQLARLWGHDDLLVGGASGARRTGSERAVLDVFAGDATGAFVLAGADSFRLVSRETGSDVDGEARVFGFPSSRAGQHPALTGAGDLAVALRDGPRARALLAWLASPEASEERARLGDFVSPNRSTDPAAYPSNALRVAAESLTGAGDEVRLELGMAPTGAAPAIPVARVARALRALLGHPERVASTAQALDRVVGGSAP